MKWVTSLNVIHKTIKHLEGIIRRIPSDPGFGYDFLDTTPKVQFMKGVIDKMNFIKIKNCSVRQCQENEKTSHRLKEKKLAKDTSDNNKKI